MLTLREAYGHYYNYKKTDGTYGMEIETETEDSSVWPEGFFESFEDNHGNTKYKIPMVNWEGHYDGSLRNFGMEFVFKKPLTFEKANEALDVFGKTLADIPFLTETPSTSVHVHVNMLDESLMTLSNFIATYILVENVLIEYSGEHRRSNLFALPIRVARNTLDNLIKLIQSIYNNINNPLNFHSNSVKYAAINIAPLSRFGSLEVRMFRGEVNSGENKMWLTMIHELLEFSRRDMTPRDILKMLTVRRIDEILDDIFPSMSEVIKSRVQDYQLLVEKNFLYLANFATCIPDWRRLTEKIEEAKKLSEETKPKVIMELKVATPGFDPAADYPEPVDNLLNLIVGDDDDDLDF